MKIGRSWVQKLGSDEAFLAAGSTLPLAPSDHGLQGDQAQVRLAEDGRAWVEQDAKQSQLVMSCPQVRRRRSVQAPRASQGGWEPTSPSSLERGWVYLACKVIFDFQLLPQLGECIDHKEFIRSAKTYSFECPFPFINHIHWTLL